MHALRQVSLTRVPFLYYRPAMLLPVKFSLLASLIASAASAPAEIVIHNQITVAEVG